MDYTKSIGNVTELQCLSKFIEMGFDCSIPYGDACKYDFIADVGGELLRIQCKTCNNPLKKDGTKDTEAIMFYTVSQTTNTKKTSRHRYTADDIDYFATWYQGQVYLVSVNECSTSKTLRFSPPQNGQLNNYNKAEDYLIETIIGHCQNEQFVNQKNNKKNATTNKKIFICTQCNKNTVCAQGGICYSCSNINQRIVARPNREELKRLIRNKSFLEIGRSFNVTDNTIRKWCKAENLPQKKRAIDKYSEKEWNNI